MRLESTKFVRNLNFRKSHIEKWIAGELRLRRCLKSSHFTLQTGDYVKVCEKLEYKSKGC